MTSECSICHTKESMNWLHFDNYTLCTECAKDYQEFKLQPENYNNIVILMEVYFRRGKGEKITYEQLHKAKAHFKFITFMDIFELKDN
jgi:hypothetical protein